MLDITVASLHLNFTKSAFHLKNYMFTNKINVAIYIHMLYLEELIVVVNTHLEVICSPGV